MGDEMAADFALSAVREDGVWSVTQLPPAAADDLKQMVHALRQQPGDTGAIGLLSFAEDFFVVMRMVGDDVRILLSDVTAAFDAPFAGQVLDYLKVIVEMAAGRPDIGPEFTAYLKDFLK